MEKKNLALNIENLSVKYKIYEGILEVIPGLSMHVEQAERVGLIGETGCGKTTVLKSAAAVLQSPPAIVHKDAIEVCGVSVDGKKGLRSVRRNVSMIFQDPSSSLNPTLKISTQMTDILKSQFPGKRKTEYGQMMLDALDSVSMPAPERVLGSYPVQLSGGMRQRVCIAMALMKDTNLMLADEPTTALDVTIQAQILDLINRLRNDLGMAVLLITHDLGVVAETADRVVVMYCGRVVEQATVMQLFTKPLHPYTRGLMDSIPKLDEDRDRLYMIKGIVPDPTHLPKGCSFADRCDHCMEKCREHMPKLVETEDGRQVRCFLVSDEEEPEEE